MTKIKIDCAMITRDPAEASAVSKRLEDLGYDGAYTFEGPHEPFLPLAAAALATKKLELLTSIAVAFSRNPMTLANLGYDLQLMSQGRFTLGLGSQIKPHIEKDILCLGLLQPKGCRKWLMLLKLFGAPGMTARN